MKLLIFFILLFCVCGSSFQKIELTSLDSQWIEVEVQGEIENPGFFSVRNRTPLQDILDKLLYLNSADLTNVNGSLLLHEGDKIIIPKRIEKNRISINFSSKKELMQLPGIGEKTAQSIIDHREKYGLFQQLEDLMQVRGIKGKTFEKLKDDISL